MGLQARMSQGDPRLYNPNRDVAHNFEGVVKLVCKRLSARSWPDLNKLLADSGVTDAEMAEALNGLVAFIRTSVDDPKESMYSAAVRCGFFKVRPEARIAILAVIGQVTLGYHWAGVHEATINGDGPVLSLQDLAVAGARAAAILSLPRWQRWLITWYFRIRRLRHGE